MDYKILVVEDEGKLREVLKDYFASKGDECVLAENGIKAMEIIEDQEFDAVLLEFLKGAIKGVLSKGDIYNYAFANNTDEVIVFDRRYYTLDGTGDKTYNPNADFILVTASAYRPM